MSAKRVLLLIGSPRAAKSSSAVLAQQLASGLHTEAHEIEELVISHALRTAERRAALLAAVDRADLIVLAAPVYVDSLPAALIRGLELIAEHRRQQPRMAKVRLVAIANCGFPEASHCEIALQICAEFARETGMAWYGGIAVGEGGMIHQLLSAPQPQAFGKPTRGIALGLRAAAHALNADQPIPAAVLAQIARPMLPHRIYLLLASIRWNRLARTNQVWHRLRQQPYARPARS